MDNKTETMSEDRSRALLELLMSINREIAAALDLRTVLQRLLTAVIQHVGGERGSIVVMDDKGKPIDATIVYGKRFHEHTTQQLRDTVERGLAGWVVKNRKPALVPDTSKDERWLRRADDAVERTGSKSALCVPLMARDRLIGVLTLVHSTPNVFDGQHLELMQAIADQASVAVLNARLYTESQRTARVMSALADGAAAMNTSLELQDVWRHLLNQTMQALQVETAAIALLDGANELVFKAAAGRNFGNIPGKRVKIGEGLAGAVASKGQGLIVPNVSQDYLNSEADRFEGVEMRAVTVVPILSQGKVLGVLEAINPISGVFDPDAMIVMAGLGNLAGTTIQNAQFMERLQQAHRRYRELYEDSIDPIIITDWEGNVLEVNRRAVELSGFSNDELHGMSIDQIHKVNWSRTGLNFETLKTGQECRYESVLYSQSGSTRPVEVHARRVDFEEADSAQWILRDITERKELDSLRDDMTAMIYHDLRSPLSNIVSSLDMMNALLPEDETLHTMLNIANNSTMRINRLINSLLDINRLESGQPIVDQQAVDPTALITESIRDVMPTINSRRQSLEEKIAPSYPLIWVDVDMIHRVLINLMENSSKFTPTEGRVEIGAEADGIYVKFWVRDNGPGIPEADRYRIFDKFTRLRNNKDKPGGLGVGLAFCKLAVQGHGGSIWVESEIGKGTTFWITLPVAQKKATGQLKRQTGRLTIKPQDAHRFQGPPSS